MPFPVATGRIVVPYVIDGLTHVIHAWVRNPQLVGSDWMINSRATDANDTHWYDAAHALAINASNILPTGTTLGSILLQTRSGGVFTTVDTTTGTLPNLAGTTFASAQNTMTLRDVQFHRFKQVIMEGPEIPPYHTVDPLAFGAEVDAYIKEFTPSHTISTPPYTWLVSGWNQYINPSGFVSMTGTLNRKLRRARGLV